MNSTRRRRSSRLATDRMTSLPGASAAAAAHEIERAGHDYGKNDENDVEHCSSFLWKMGLTDTKRGIAELSYAAGLAPTPPTARSGGARSQAGAGAGVLSNRPVTAPFAEEGTGAR